MLNIAAMLKITKNLYEKYKIDNLCLLIEHLSKLNNNRSII